jgi:hypothetical protein
MTTITVNVPGRLIDFYQGGDAYAVYDAARFAKREPAPTRELGADELALFAAVDAGRSVRPSKGGYYVRAALTLAAIDALRYWAQTLASASADDARYGDQDARNDLRAAQRVLTRLSETRKSA